MKKNGHLWHCQQVKKLVNACLDMIALTGCEIRYVRGNVNFTSGPHMKHKFSAFRNGVEKYNLRFIGDYVWEPETLLNQVTKVKVTKNNNDPPDDLEPLKLRC